MRYLAFGIIWLVLGFVFAWMFGNAKRLGGRKHLALLMLLLFTTPALASPVVRVSEPSPKQAYEQRWERNVRYCAWRVSQYTQRPVVYQIGVYGAIPRYTTDRQERLLVACLETLTTMGR